MLDAKIEQVSPYWSEVSKILYIPHSQKEYDEAVRLLDNLIDTIGEDENHPLASLMEILGFIIEKYEDEHVPEITDTTDDINESEWLKASLSNPAFEYLRDPEEDIYTIKDGKPFYEA
jgi:HTH-type transcriptional regulator/antitoxin HigA